MRVETTLIQQTIGNDKRGVRSEAIAWARLFDRKYINRTLIGISMMFFQRKCLVSILSTTAKWICAVRMEWDKCITLLWPYPSEEHWPQRRHGNFDGVGRHWDRSIYCRSTRHYLH